MIGLNGLWLALAVFLSLSFLCLFFGDSWILSKTESIPLSKANDLWEKSLNLISIKDLGQMDLYISEKFSSAFACLVSPTGKCSVIMGQNLFSMLSDKEIKLLLEFSTNYLKTKPAFFREQLSLTLSILLWPSTIRLTNKGYRFFPNILRKVLSPFYKLMGSVLIVYRFLSFPIGMLKSNLIRYKSPVDEVGSKGMSDSELKAIALKIKHSKVQKNNKIDLSWLMLEDLALIPFGDSRSFVFNHYLLKTDLE